MMDAFGQDRRMNGLPRHPDEKEPVPLSSQGRLAHRRVPEGPVSGPKGVKASDGESPRICAGSPFRRPIGTLECLSHVVSDWMLDRSPARVAAMTGLNEHCTVREVARRSNNGAARSELSSWLSAHYAAYSGERHHRS
jgi:hypothetical protein